MAETKVYCIVCSGEHQPTSPMVCDEDGMDREIARMGAQRWNRITKQVMRQAALKALASQPTST